jgi:drug/metabolite transporter (DMT)-like permease
MDSEQRQDQGGLWWKSPVAAAVLTMFFWAATTIVVRYVRNDIPPLGLSFWRTFTALLIMLPFAAKPLLRQWDLVRRNLGLLALLALLLWVGGNALLFLSLQYTTAINAAVINSIEPLIIILLAALLFRDRLTWRQGAGVAMSLLGVLILIVAGSLDRLLALDFNKGDLIVTGAYIAWGLYAVLLRKLPREMDPKVMLVVLLGLGSLFLLPLYAAETTWSRPMPFTPPTVITVIGLALFPCAMAMLLWNYAIRQMGAVRAGQYLHLIPAFTVALALGFLGEELGPHHIAGIALIAAGIFTASRK